MKISSHDIARLIDASALKIDTSDKDLKALVDACRKYDFIAAFIWPAFSKELGEGLKGSTTRLGTSLSFPSGQEPTVIKVRQAEYFVSIGAAEIDMVMNVGLLKSGRLDEVRSDISAVRQVAGSTPLKVIVEAMLLSDAELVTACKIVMECDAAFVKTGTGFSAAPSTLHHVELMKRTIGERIKLKVAGGVRDLTTLLRMYVMGADRFGIGLANSIAIVEEAQKHPEGVELPSAEECLTALRAETGTGAPAQKAAAY